MCEVASLLNRYYFRLSKSESSRNDAGSLPIPGTQPGVSLQWKSHILQKLFAIGISMQNESRLYWGDGSQWKNVGRRLICIHHRQPISGKFPSVSWPIRFACYPSAKLLMFRIAQNLAWLTREWRPFVVSHARRKWSERSIDPTLKRGSTYVVLRLFFTIYQTEILGYNQSISYKCHRINQCYHWSSSTLSKYKSVDNHWYQCQVCH